ncbi:MAG: hypothetical protein K8S87_10225 [Planctomycetes bacterium]|nr:hypothetical protein [Planctomycetota bacterium]
MSERLKSRYLRKREELSSNSRKYFIAGLLFAFFMLFLFHQFRAIILKPISACEDSAKIYEATDIAESLKPLEIHEPTVNLYKELNKTDSEQAIKELRNQNDEKTVNTDEIKSEIKPTTADKSRINLHYKNIQKIRMKEKSEKRRKLN